MLLADVAGDSMEAIYVGHDYFGSIKTLLFRTVFLSLPLLFY